MEKERTIYFTIDGTNLTGAVWADTNTDNTQRNTLLSKLCSK